MEGRDQAPLRSALMTIGCRFLTMALPCTSVPMSSGAGRERASLLLTQLNS